MDIREKIFEICIELSGCEDITEEKHLQDDLGLDSLSMVTLLIEIEDTFDIELEESDMNPYDLNTVEDIIDLVEKYRGD